MIVGIDEVGRGPWAGPLVFGAVILGDADIEGLTDSKKLTRKKREALAPMIYDKALAVGLGWVQADELDAVGLAEACRLACRRALEEITVSYGQIIIDGTVNFLKDTGKGPYVTTMKQADLLVPSVSAASIVAKVARDTFMYEMAELYPEYGFESHVGYGTKAHSEALQKHGVTSLHRQSFAPISKLILASSSHKKKPFGSSGLPGDSFSETKQPRVTSRQIGDSGEDVAAEYLVKHGFEIIDRNWKTKVCEIDIVARKGETVYFCEVKHRKTDRQGGGLEAITKKKYNQMMFAVRVFAHYFKLNDTNMRLVVVATTGTPPEVVEFIEL